MKHFPCKIKNIFSLIGNTTWTTEPEVFDLICACVVSRKEREPVDMDTYNDEEKRLDREWYGMDEGQDEYQNAFSNISDEYIKVRQFILIQFERYCASLLIQW